MGANLRPLLPAVAAMIVVVAAANVLVQHPIEAFGAAEWLTWGAFTYPLSFLVTDLTNRRFGPEPARRVVYVGFALGAALSIALAGPRIALASGAAFLAGQLLDIHVFDRLRRQAWWRAPLASSLLASALDTALFFSLAFAFTPVPWPTLALGDFVVKVAMALVLLAPFRAAMALIRARPLAA